MFELLAKLQYIINTYTEMIDLRTLKRLAPTRNSCWPPDDQRSKGVEHYAWTKFQWKITRKLRTALLISALILAHNQGTRTRLWICLGMSVCSVETMKYPWIRRNLFSILNKSETGFFGDATPVLLPLLKSLKHIKLPVSIMMQCYWNNLLFAYVCFEYMFSSIIYLNTWI